MSRRIVQLAVTTAPEISQYGEATQSVPWLFALDNNGVAWLMIESKRAWVRLPALPSIENRPAPVVGDHTGPDV